jgi:hypothetical protein
LQNIYQQYRNQGVMVLSLGFQESVASCATWRSTYNLTYPVLSDISGSVGVSYIPNNGGLWFPHNAIVDQNQIVQYTATGFSASAIQNTLNSLMEPRIATDTDYLDFGTVNQGSSEERTFTIYNDGTGIVSVAYIEPSGSSFSPDPQTGQVYAYNDSLVVTVTFVPTHTGAYSDSLSISSTGGDAVVTITGVGESVAVENVSVIRLAQHIGISWTAIPSADGYNVYAASNPNVPIEAANLLGHTTSNTYLDPNILSQNGVSKRFYRITAVFQE